MFKLYWVSDDGDGVLFDLGEVLKKCGFVFIGRLRDEDVYGARRFGVVEKSYYSLYIFKPHEYYHPMNIVDSLVSRRHALLELRGDSLFIVDYGSDGRGSKNGTFINEKRINPGKPHLLKHGDEISLGSLTKLRVIYGDLPISVDTPTVLGKREVEVLRSRGVDVAVKYSEEASKPVMYIQQEISDPIVTPSGLKIIAKPDPHRTLFKLLVQVMEARIKILSRESDAKSSIAYLLDCIDLAPRDIERILREKGKLVDFVEAKKVLEHYTRGYMIDDRIVREKLERLESILKAAIEMQPEKAY